MTTDLSKAQKMSIRLPVVINTFATRYDGLSGETTTWHATAYVLGLRVVETSGQGCSSEAAAIIKVRALVHEYERNFKP